MLLLVSRQHFRCGRQLDELRQGRAAIEAYQKKALALGSVMSPEAIRRDENFGLAMNELKTASEGLKNTIGDALTSGVAQDDPVTDGQRQCVREGDASGLGVEWPEPGSNSRGPEVDRHLDGGLVERPAGGPAWAGVP